MLSRVIAKNVGDVFLRHSVVSVGLSLGLAQMLLGWCVFCFSELGSVQLS